MSPAWEPPGAPTRVLGGMLGVAGGESWRGTGEGPATTALVDLCNSYVAHRGDGVPVDVARSHDGVSGPGWLLAVAVVRPDEAELVAETLELALVAGVSSHSLGDCVAYVTLAAALFAGEPVEMAVQGATGRPLSEWVTPGESPLLCGESVRDALSAGVWAVAQSGGVADVVSALAAVAPPGVGAAAAGLVGLRDGGGAVPAQWHRQLRCAATCVALAPGLVRARCRRYLGHPSMRRTAVAAEVVGAGPLVPSSDEAYLNGFLNRPLVRGGSLVGSSIR